MANIWSRGGTYGNIWDKLKQYGYNYKDWDLSKYDPKGWGPTGTRSNYGLSYDPSNQSWLTNVWGKQANFGRLGEAALRDEFSWLPNFDPGKATGRYPFEGIAPSITSEDLVTLQGRNYFGREQRANQAVLDKYKRLSEMGYKHLDPRAYTQFDPKMGTLGGLGGGEPYPVGRHGQTGGLYQDSLGNWHRRAAGLMAGGDGSDNAFPVSGSGSGMGGTGGGKDASSFAAGMGASSRNQYVGAGDDGSSGRPIGDTATDNSMYTGAWMDKTGIFKDFAKNGNTLQQYMDEDLARSSKGFNDVENSLRSVINLGIYGPEGGGAIVHSGPVKVQRQLDEMLPNLITQANQSEILGRANAAKALANSLGGRLAGQTGQLSNIMADKILLPSLQNQANRNMALSKDVQEQKNQMDLAISDLIKENMQSKYQALQDLAQVAQARSGRIGMFDSMMKTSSDKDKMDFNEKMAQQQNKWQITRDRMQQYYTQANMYYEYLMQKEMKGDFGWGDILGWAAKAAATYFTGGAAAPAFALGGSNGGGYGGNPNLYYDLGDAARARGGFSL